MYVATDVNFILKDVQYFNLRMQWILTHKCVIEYLLYFKSCTRAYFHQSVVNQLRKDVWLTLHISISIRNNNMIWAVTIYIV